MTKKVKIKLFQNTDLALLEADVNAFLDTLDFTQFVVSSHMTTTMVNANEDRFTILIFYSEPA